MAGVRLFSPDEQGRRKAHCCKAGQNHGHALRAQYAAGSAAFWPDPSSRTSDYSDVFVLDADGRRIPWTEVSRIDDDEMRRLMQEIVNRLYTFHVGADDPKLQATIERWMGAAMTWDEPEIDHRMISCDGIPSDQ